MMCRNLRYKVCEKLLTGSSGGSMFQAALVLVIFLACASTTAAQERSLWQIGKRDNGSLEFNQEWDFSRGKDPIFVVGTSDPKKDWSHFQPGMEDSDHDRRAHPFTIEFQLTANPQGTFYLEIDLFFKEPLLPRFVVQVNGKKGQYWLHPSQSYDLGDPEMFDDIIPSTQHLRIPFAAALFQAGKNTLVLSCEGESGSAILSGQSTARVPSGIYYDAIELRNDATRRFDERHLEAQARPTIFYRQGKDETSQLNEVVLLDAEIRRPFASGKASLTLGGKSYVCSLPGGYDFGESECAVDVREFSGKSSAKLTVEVGKITQSFPVSLTAQKKWKLFEVPQNHIDAGYTDYRPKAYEVHNRNLDQAVEVIASHPWYKFNLDGSWDLAQYWSHRDQSRIDRAVAALREDRIGLPAFNFTVDSGIVSQEELYRLAYFSENLGRRYGVPVEYANQTDVPAYTWAMPSMLHDLNVKYFSVASDPYRGPILLYGRLNEKSPFWWEGPDGKKVLTWYSWDYIQMGFLCGIRVPTMHAGVTSVPIFVQPYSSPSYTGDAIMIFGNVSDNRPFNPYDVQFSQDWNKEFAYPKIVMATVPDFFKYMEQNFGSSFVTLRGDGGATWDEMIAADAKRGAIARKAAERVIGAEALASLGVITNTGYQFPTDEDHDLWRNLLLYVEHSWGGIGRTWKHPEQKLVSTLFRAKQSFITQAEIQVDDLLRRGLDQLTSKVSAGGDMVVVFNPLSWERGGFVELDLPRGSSPLDPTTGQPVPSEVLRRVVDEDVDRVRFWADGVPSLGYRCYNLSKPVPSAPISPSDSESADANTRVIENRFYRITVDPSRGGISSIYDKELRRELVNANSTYALDQYVYAGYGHEGVSNFRQRTEFNSTVLQYGPALPAQELQLSVAGAGKVVSVKKAFWGTELKLTTSAAHTPEIEVSIRLFDQTKRIELINRLHKEVVKAPEAVYFAFPFAGQHPTVRFEIQNGWVDPSKDMLLGANTEWFAAQHWVSVTDSEHTAVLALNESPLFTIGDIVRGHWPKALEAKDGTIFSYVMNNYDGDDDLPYQGGDFTFHYVLTSEREFDSARLAKFSREASNPLEENYVRMGFDRHEPSTEVLKAEPNSFLSISDDQIILSAWKAAEDARGYVLRFYNTTDRPAEAQVGFPHLLFDRVDRTNAAEVDQKQAEVERGELKISLGPHEIGTYRVTGFRLQN